MDKALLFLIELNRLMPDGKGKHNLTVSDDKLIITIFLGQKYRQFSMNTCDGDFWKDPVVLARDIYAQMKDDLQ